MPFPNWFLSVPVSYTHLDVYKRQRTSCDSLAQKLFNETRHIHNTSPLRVLTLQLSVTLHNLRLYSLKFTRLTFRLLRKLLRAQSLIKELISSLFGRGSTTNVCSVIVYTFMLPTGGLQ